MLNPAILEDALSSLPLYDSEPAVRIALSSAYRDYMLTSAVLGSFALNPLALESARAAMDSALTGISTPQAGGLIAAQLLVSGIAAFWSSALASATTIWVTVPPLVPAPVTMPVALLTPESKLAVANSLAAVFVSNLAGQLSQSQSSSAIVAVLHPAGAGATVTQATVPTPTPGLPVL